MKSLLSIFYLLLISLSLTGQSKFSIIGNVIDTQGESLTGSTVTILSHGDSVLLAFAITNKDGEFEIKHIKNGRYIIQATYLGYSSFSESIIVSNENLHMSEITLHPAVSMLDQVMVKAEFIPIVINGDTIQYNAAAFKTKPNAVVEDLLKKLPGVEVRADGSIRAQGEEVQNILVNGKEFFGDDIRIATQNLPADAVDKVEVYDKKSDMAEFSGIDDGQEEKTINLELKDGKENGSFGKLMAGYGTDEHYTTKGNWHHFSPKMQFSTIGMLNNTNEQGFSLNEYMNLMGGLSSMMSNGGGSMSFSLDADNGIPLDFGNNGQTGLMTTSAIGTNLNYEFNKKTELNGSYFYSKIEHLKDRNLFRHNFTESDNYDYTESSLATTNNSNHRLNLRLDHKLDSFSSIIFRTNVGMNDQNQLSQQLSNTYNSAKLLENSSSQEYYAEGQNFRFGSNLMYRRKFRKAGRFVVANASLDNNTEESSALIEAQNSFFDAEQLPTFIDTLNQDQFRDNEQLNYSGRLSYTEPLGKGNYIEANYSHQNYSNQLSKIFYDRLTGERVQNTLLSNEYEQNYLYDNGGISYRRNKKSSNFNLSLKVQKATLKGDISSLSDPIHKDFTHLLPSMSWQYDFTTSRNISFRYRSSVQQPSLRQLQPIIDNSNPLNIYKGNPELKPEYSHNMNLHFMSFDQFSFVNFFGSVNLRYTRDQISFAQTIDSLFRQSVQPINVKDETNLRANFSFSAPIRAIKSRINIDWNPAYNQRRVFVNGLENINQLVINNIGFSIENRNKKTIDAIIGTQLSHNNSQYSKNEQLNQSFLNQTYYVDFSLNTKNNWIFSTSFDLDIYSAENFGQQQSFPIWQASLSKLMMKNKLEIKCTVFDIMDKNQGIDRQTQSNYSQEVNTRTPRRYIMLSATYSIKGFGNKGGIEIETSGRR